MNDNKTLVLKAFDTLFNKRDYAAAELSALIVSWLAALGGRVLNPASARGFSGAWRSRSEWSSR